MMNRLHSLCRAPHWLSLIGCAAIGLWGSANAAAQIAHYLENGDAPTGQIGQTQRMIRQSMQGFDQAIHLIGPEDARWSYWDGQSFVEAGTTTADLKMQVGSVYQLKVSGLPQREGVELYPTLELINRLYPPEGQAEAFPVIVELPMADLLQAIEGKLVTRVVYLEDPETAMPYRQTASEQPFFDVHPQEDVLQVATRLGRPMAIVRIGSRIPNVALPAK